MKVLKVEIGLTAQGKGKYPHFDSLAIIESSGIVESKPGLKDKWCRYLQRESVEKWLLYDWTTGHAQVSAGSPSGIWLAILIVPDVFADQAAAAFDECTILSDVEAQTFYEGKVTVYEPDEIIDAKVLADIKAKEDLSLPLTQAQIDAKDPSNDQPGVVTSKTKTWAAFKTTNTITIS
jgi:hypothetical protein